MVEKKFKIINEVGIHARPAAAIVQKALQFKSEISLVKDGMSVNAKSIMGVLMLAASKNSIITVRAEGLDAERAVEAVGQLIQSKFGEM